MATRKRRRCKRRRRKRRRLKRRGRKRRGTQHHQCSTDILQVPTISFFLPSLPARTSYNLAKIKFTLIFSYINLKPSSFFNRIYRPTAYYMHGLNDQVACARSVWCVYEGSGGGRKAEGKREREEDLREPLLIPHTGTAAQHATKQW